MSHNWVYFAIISAFICCVNTGCICNVKKNGEYCGTELNRINRNNDCTRDQYLCGNSNRNRTAVIVKRCSTGNECDVIKYGGISYCNLEFLHRIT